MKAKRCRACGQADLLSSKEQYRYDESGLPNVLLEGITVRRCPACHEFEVVIPRVTELHRAIVLAVVQKTTRLTGAEVRFLRKYLGYSGVDFARRMGVSPEVVSKWEHDKDPIGGQSDRLLRLLAIRDRPVEEYSDERLAAIDDNRHDPISIDLRPVDGGWQSAA
jgi:putative zinc finger/helix-turn-helix YgiT family protein